MKKRFMKISEELLKKVGNLTEKDTVVINVPAGNILDTSTSGENSIINYTKRFWKNDCQTQHEVIVNPNTTRYTTLDIKTKE